MEISHINCPFCGENIKKHPSGACMDAWVAKDVMKINVLGDWGVWDPDDSGFSLCSDQSFKKYVYVQNCECASIESDVEELKFIQSFFRMTYGATKIHGHYPYCLQIVPDYSTDLNRSFKDVIDKMQDGFSYSVTHTCRFSSVMQHPFAMFKSSVHPPEYSDLHEGEGIEKQEVYYSTSREIGLAICRAAIIAVTLKKW